MYEFMSLTYHMLYTEYSLQVHVDLYSITQTDDIL